MVIFGSGVEIPISIGSNSQLMLLGGEPIDGERRIWWNFVASKAELMEQAKGDWNAGRFEPVPNETERIPLPD